MNTLKKYAFILFALCLGHLSCKNNNSTETVSPISEEPDQGKIEFDKIVDSTFTARHKFLSELPEFHQNYFLEGGVEGRWNKKNLEKDSLSTNPKKGHIEKFIKIIEPSLFGNIKIIHEKDYYYSGKRAKLYDGEGLKPTEEYLYECLIEDFSYLTKTTYYQLLTFDTTNQFITNTEKYDLIQPEADSILKLWGISRVSPPKEWWERYNRNIVFRTIPDLIRPRLKKP